MKRIATTTVIRGNGGCEAYFNGILKEEIRKLNERYKAKEAELAASKKHCNRLLAHQLNTLEVYSVKKKSIFRKLLDGIGILWFKIWALGWAIGLWDYVENKKA